MIAEAWGETWSWVNKKGHLVGRSSVSRRSMQSCILTYSRHRKSLIALGSQYRRGRGRDLDLCVLGTPLWERRNWMEGVLHGDTHGWTSGFLTSYSSWVHRHFPHLVLFQGEGGCDWRKFCMMTWLHVEAIVKQLSYTKFPLLVQVHGEAEQGLPGRFA